MIIDCSRELIKVSGSNHPLNEMMDDSLTEKQCDDIMNMMRYCLENNDFEMFKNSEYYTESYMCEGVIGDFFIKQLIKLMEVFCKNKYKLSVSKYYAASKEINDIYTKVSYLLQHDKVARFKHRNDLVNITTKSTVMVDKTDGTIYNIQEAELFYSTIGIKDMVDAAMNSIKDECTKEQGEALRKNADAIVYNTNLSFAQKYGYVDSCTVEADGTTYNNVKLEDCIMYFKDAVARYYNNIAVINYDISDQMRYIKFLENMYNTYTRNYGNNADCKYYIDEVFKCVIDNMTKSMEFNNSIVETQIECIKYSSDQLHKIYNTLKK